MAFSLTADMGYLKQLPAYSPVLKAILKSQIQLLMDQLSEHGGDECVLLAASLSDGTLFHVGSKFGREFVENHEEIKSKFLQFCFRRGDFQTQLKERPRKCPIKSKHKQTNSSLTSVPKKKKRTKKPDCCVNASDTDEAKTVGETLNNSLNSKVSAGTQEILNLETNPENIDFTNSSCSLMSVRPMDVKSGEDINKVNFRNDEEDSNSNSVPNLSQTDEKNVNDGFEKNTGEPTETGSANSDIVIHDGNLIIKLEQSWNPDDEEYTINMEDITNFSNTTESKCYRDAFHKTNSECRTSGEESADANEITGKCTSSGNRNVKLDAKILCCNDDLIWKRNQQKQKRILKTESLRTKYSVIMEVEKGLKSKTEIANKLGIPKSTLWTWLKHSDKIKSHINNDSINPHRKKGRFSNHYDIEESLLEWLKIVQLQAVVPKITSVNICDKANQLAKQLGYTADTFQCTTSWVERFKTRHGFNKNFVRADACGGD